MGVNSSTELSRLYSDISKWPKSRVESVITNYNEGEYDFGIDYTVITHITGLDVEESQELVKCHCRNDSVNINAITLLITLVSIGNIENRDEIGRLEKIFDLLDFSNSGQISMDEFTILLLCVGSSYSFIINRQPEEGPIDHSIVQFAKYVYESIGKRTGTTMKKNELVEWAKEHIFGKGYLNINDIFSCLINGLDVGGDKLAENSVASSITNN